MDCPDDHQSTVNAIGGYTTDSLVNEGTGENYGVELTLEKFFSRNYYFMLSGAVYKSKYTALDGVERSTYFDGGFNFQLLGGKEFPTGIGKNRLGVSTKLIASGGKRYPPVLLEESIEEDETVYDWNKAYTEHADPYFRLDLQGYFRINRPKTTHTIKLDIQNVTNRLNDWYQYFDRDTQEVEVATLTGMIPVLSYKIEF